MAAAGSVCLLVVLLFMKSAMTHDHSGEIEIYRDCQPVEPVSVDEYGFMRFHQVSDKDAGKYTCLIDISLNGKTYTAARSIQLTINNDTVYTDLEVVSPQEDVVVVEVGMRWELKCLAYIGFSEDNDILMYWTVDREFTEDYKELNQSLKYIHHKDKVFRLCTLYISEVRRWFLNVPFYCHIISPVKAISHMVMLQEADHSPLHTSVALCLTASFVILVLAPASVFFKVDLVLVYRKLLRRVSKKQAPDGKLYDGYVTFSYPNTLSSTEVVNFALQILPEELENKHGYSLYIRGRDDCPGQAVHDVIAATVHQCRRLIIILPPQETSADDGETEKELSLCDDQIWWYEQKLGLHSALTHKDLQVILVEIGGPVDYSRLPESLRYIKRKQGALKWRTASLGTHKLTTLCSNRRFWKNLRYYMPSVPARRLQTIV